jgi:anti-sigma regulatory factor (Ser/Thr protein kinase)
MGFTRQFEIVGDDFANAGKVSTEIKALLKNVGYSSDAIRRLVIAVYEAEMNVVMYAKHGRLTLELAPHRLHVVLDDDGPGIPDIGLAMQEGYSTATPEMRERGFGAGMGLPNIQRNTDRFDIASVVGRGTRLDFAVLTGATGGRTT